MIHDARSPDVPSIGLLRELGIVRGAAVVRVYLPPGKSLPAAPGRASPTTVVVVAYVAGIAVIVSGSPLGSSSRVTIGSVWPAVIGPPADTSIGTRHSEVMLGEVVQRHLIGHRAEAVQAQVAPVPLDPGLDDVACPAERLDCAVGRG